jgi:hypothetical protein
MLHMKRLHQVQETTPNSPLSRTYPASPDPQIKLGGEGVPTTSCYNSPVLEVLESRNSTFSNKTAITEKIHELETMKEKAIAKFDGDIAALRRVLSIM